MKNDGYRLLVLEPSGLGKRACSIFNRIGMVDFGPMSRDELRRNICKYDILVTRLGHVISADILQAASRLKVIVTPTTALNHIELQVANSRGIDVLSLKGEREFLDGIHATAEHAWGLTLALTRKYISAVRHVQSGGWDRELFKGHELNGKVLGIIGLGRLGTKLARYGHAFGMRVIGFDTDDNCLVPEGVQFKSFDEVIGTAYVLSVHVTSGSQNRNIIGPREFNMMQEDVSLVNTSRGEVIDEDALLRALRHRKIRGAALDVLCGEYEGWDGSRPLLEYAKENDNLLITPHIGGCTHDSIHKTEEFLALKLERYITQLQS